MHLHLYRRRQDGTWLNDLQDDAWIVANLRAALGRFEAWNGGPCRHFSVGDNLLTPAIQDALEQAGVWYDYTAIPDYDATATMTAREGLAWRGRIPSARGMPRKPYRPRRGNPYRAALWPRRTALRMIPGPSGSLGRGIAGRWALRFSSDTAESERVLASWLDEVGGMLVARTRSDHFLDRLQAIDARLDFLARRSQGACFTTADRVPGLAPPA